MKLEAASGPSPPCCWPPEPLASQGLLGFLQGAQTHTQSANPCSCCIYTEHLSVIEEYLCRLSTTYNYLCSSDYSKNLSNKTFHFLAKTKFVLLLLPIQIYYQYISFIQPVQKLRYKNLTICSFTRG